jgi:rhodanese-related sulfurtransferase
MSVQSINVKTLRTRMESGDGTVILDVRSTEEFAEAHVEGAVHVPGPDIARAALDFHPDARFVVVCTKGGGRSQSAATMLTALGRDAVVLEGGTLAWLNEKMPS